MDLRHIWTFVLWWVAIAVLVGAGKWVALFFTLVTFPGAHVFSWGAQLLLHVVRWQ